MISLSLSLSLLFRLNTDRLDIDCSVVDQWMDLYSVASYFTNQYELNDSCSAFLLSVVSLYRVTLGVVFGLKTMVFSP